jgi:hypothetical protein
LNLFVVYSIKLLSPKARRSLTEVPLL